MHRVGAGSIKILPRVIFLFLLLESRVISGSKIPSLNWGHAPRFKHKSRDGFAGLREVALAFPTVRISLGTAGRTCLTTVDTRPSVARAPPRSSSSRLAKWLSHSVQHRVEVPAAPVPSALAARLPDRLR